MNSPLLRRPRILATLFVTAIGCIPDAAAQTWNFTEAGTTYNWNDPLSWTPGTVPNQPGAIANVNVDILGNQTIRLQQDITIGTLNIGDADGSHAFTIASGTGTNSLIFDSGNAGVAAQINLGNTAELTQTISAPIILNSALQVNVGGLDSTNAQRISFTGAFATNDRPITFLGGVEGETQITFAAGTLLGGTGSVITNSSNGAMVFNGIHDAFTGKIVVNNVASGSNVAGMTISNNGSLQNASEFEINGYLTGGHTQRGGTVWVGNGSAIANPTSATRQRLTENRITFNGGTLNAGGQPLTSGETDREVRDTVAVMDFNSGYSLLSISSSTTNGGSTRLLNVTEVERSPGASAFVRASQFGNPDATNATTFKIGNSGDYLTGAGAASGTNQSIIPWMVVANTNTSAQNGDTFATYDANGIRGLVTTAGGDYATSITAGAEHNFSGAGVTIGGVETKATINSVRYTAGGASNIGAGKTLAVVSGGVIFTGAGSIGSTGNASAGTLQFGEDDTTVEGVVWSLASNTNTIGASISGSGGLSKAGTGTLVLTGLENDYTGLTYVGGGKLQVGDAFNASSLGLSLEIRVAAGTELWLMGGNMIQDGASLTLEEFGHFSGKLYLASTVNETISSLFFGSDLALPGTYGSSTSTATFKNDDLFQGDGVLTVVPEPASAAFLLGGLGVLLGRRRRRQAAR